MGSYARLYLAKLMLGAAMQSILASTLSPTYQVITALILLIIVITLERKSPTFKGMLLQAAVHAVLNLTNVVALTPVQHLIAAGILIAFSCLFSIVEYLIS